MLKFLYAVSTGFYLFVPWLQETILAQCGLQLRYRRTTRHTGGNRGAAKSGPAHREVRAARLKASDFERQRSFFPLRAHREREPPFPIRGMLRRRHAEFRSTEFGVVAEGLSWSRSKRKWASARGGELLFVSAVVFLAYLIFTSTGKVVWRILHER